MVINVWALHLVFSSAVPTMLRSILGSNLGLGRYKPGRHGHVVVLGTPSARMLADFFDEIYHMDHYDSVHDFDRSAPDVVVMLPDEETLQTVRRLLSSRKCILFRS